MRSKMFYFITLFWGVLFAFSCEQDPLSSTPGEAELFESQELLKVEHGRSQVKVMTWNIYVGANVDAVLEATDPEQIPLLVATAYQELLSTNFNERAQTIAQFIKKHRPNLIGLQEVSLIQRYSSLPPAPGSLIEQFDYLQILLDKLASFGLNYQVAGQVNNADVVVPRLADPLTFDFDYVRLLDSDVVLAHQNVEISNVVTANYQAALPVPDLGIAIPRGYVAVNARVGQKTYRFVNTHLESFTDQVRLPQAQELAAALAGETLPIILVGDFNTLAPTPLDPDGGITYQFLTKDAGYMDIWPHNRFRREGEGFTASHDSDLRDVVPNLTKRIDLVFVRNHNIRHSSESVSFGPVQAVVRGDELNERTSSGMWPSDHAGIFARLHIR